MEATVSESSSSKDEDDLVCLKFLRDEVLRELRRSGNGKYLPHNRLIAILEEVRALAVNKATWEEAINSTGGSDSAPDKLHAVSTISNAIKIMLQDYLGPNVGESSPVADDHIPTREEELLAEIDSLKQSLTESECRAAEASEESQRYAAKVSDLQRKLDTLQLSQASASEEVTRRMNAARDSLKSTEERLSQSESMNKQLQAQVSSMEVELTRAKQELATYESHASSSSLLPDQVPSMHDWRVLQAQLSHLRSAAGGEVGNQLSTIENLMSQVQTLEVQKNDADAEITRLKAQLKADAFVRPDVTQTSGGLQLSTPSSTIRRANTVNIHGLHTPSVSGRRSPLAEEFVNVAANSVKSGSKKKFTRRADNQQCAQQ